jgi:carboxyl-terminal processing protease
MRKFLNTRVLIVFISLQAALLLTLLAAPTERKTAENNSSASDAASKFTPGPDEPQIANLAARMLQQFHYSHTAMDDIVSSNLLVRFMTELDPQHIHFLQADAAEFEPYHDKLDDMILKKGDVSVGRRIFSRFLQRLEQRTEYMNQLLKTEKFDFTSRDKVLLNRKDTPYPKDLVEAKKLWRERLRYDYLEEKLNRAHPSKVATAKPKSPKEIHDEIVQLFERRNARTIKTFKDWDADDVLEIYLTTLAHIYDPHSDYFGKSQLESFSISMNLALFGIGAQLKSDDGYCVIDKLVPGPAMKSKKIKPNDKIIAVAQAEQPPVDVVDMPLNKVVSLIRGKKGTEVRLTVIPVDEPSTRKVVSLIRDEIKLEDSAAKGKIIEIPSGKGARFRIGIIDLPSFYAPMDVSASGNRDKSANASYTSIDVAKLLKKFNEEKVSGVILDLRRNGGGSLEEAIRVTGLFIKTGPVVQVRDSDGTVTVDEDRDPSIVYNGPLVVLTSRFSASASEIVAGALQDHGRALLVGESATHGKGTVQSLQSLGLFLKERSTTNDPGALKVTIRKFYRPSGSSTQLRGVVPDIILPSKFNIWEGIGENSIPNAMPWDTIENASFDKLDRVEPYVTELRKRSEGRVKSDKEFQYVQEDIEDYLKHQKDKTVSLNEAERLKERREDEAREKARDEERRARKEPEQTVYDITLKLAEEKGLPPPTLKTNANLHASATNSTPPAEGSLKKATEKPALVSNEKSGADTENVEPEKPHVDAELSETEHILIDYLSLLPKEAIVTINRANDSVADKP